MRPAILLLACLTQVGSATASDLSLADLLQQAADNSPNVRVARAQQRAVQAATDSVQWGRYPLIQGQANSESDGTQSQLSIEQTLLDGGRHRTRLSGAQVDVALAVNSVDLARRQAMEEALPLAIELSGFSQLVPVYERNLQRHRAVAEVIARRVELQLDPASDLSQATTWSRQIEADIARLNQQIALARIQLEQKVKQPVNGVELPIIEETPNLAAMFEQAERLSIPHARLNLDEQQARVAIEQAKADRYPELVVEGIRRFNPAPSVDREVVRLVVRGSLGRGLEAKAAVEAAELNFAAVARQKTVLNETLRLDLSLEDARLQQAREQLPLQLELIKGLESVVASYQRQAEASRRSWLELFTTLRELNQAEIRAVELASAAQAAQIRLRFAAYNWPE